MTRSPAWLRSSEPDCSSNLSTKVVLPWSTWAMMAILRKFSITIRDPELWPDRLSKNARWVGLAIKGGDYTLGRDRM